MTAKQQPGRRLAYRRKSDGHTHILGSIYHDHDALDYFARHYSRECPDLEFLAVDLDGNRVPEPIKETDAP